MPRNISSMCPDITDDGRYLVLGEYRCEQNALKVCDAETGRLCNTIPVSMLSFKVAALGSPPKGNYTACRR